MEKKTRDLYDVIGAMAVYAALIFAITYMAFFASGCGGGSENGNLPVYSDDGVCVANCQWDGPDAVGGDTDNGRDNLSGDFSFDRADNPPQPDYGPPYVCPDPENPPEMCKPKGLWDGKCIKTEIGTFVCDDGIFGSAQCVTDSECQITSTSRNKLIKLTQEAECEQTGWGEKCNQGLNYTAECDSYWDGNEKCRIIPQEVLDNPQYPYPPCVCWDICWLPGTEWMCIGDLTPYNFTYMTFSDGGSYCKVEGSYWLSGKAFYKPGGNSLFFPTEINPVEKIEFTADKKQINYLFGGVDKTCNLM